jgi:hypothetical protein
MDLVEDAYEDELQEMYQRYTQWKMEKCIKIRKSAFFFGKWLRFTKKVVSLTPNMLIKI